MAEGPQDGTASASPSTVASATGAELPRPSKRGKQENSQRFGEGQRLPDSHRPLPASLDAEMGVLSSILLSPKDTILIAIERIDEHHFHHPAHATIYSVLLDLWKKSSPIDLITVSQAMADRNLLDQVGGPVALANLQTFLPTAANAEYYLDIMREKYLLRRMITACTSGAVRCYEEQGDVKSLIDQVEKEIFTVGETRFAGTLPTIKDHVSTAIEALDRLTKSQGAITGLSTGYKQLDNMTNGLHPGEMFVIAARPSMGKTALAMNIAEHVAVDQGKQVGIFSLEMSSSQLVQRLLCSRARVDLQKLRDGFPGRTVLTNIHKAAEALSTSGIHIDDSAGMSILELRAKSRRLKDRHGLDLIVIDYLQLLKSPTKRGLENRQIEIAEISAGIKALTKELNIPIIVLAQLNRESEKRGDGKPRLSDLRESGSIEQDADVVGLLIRSAYYAKDEEEKAEKAGEAELIIGKQRNGPTGEIPLTFLSEYTRFESRDLSHHEAA